MGALEGLGGQILDTFVKSEGWRAQERPREPERNAKAIQNLDEKGVRHGFRT